MGTFNTLVRHRKENTDVQLQLDVQLNKSRRRMLMDHLFGKRAEICF